MIIDVNGKITDICILNICIKTGQHPCSQQKEYITEILVENTLSLLSIMTESM